MLNAEKFKDEILETLDCDCEGFGVTEDNKITMCRADSFCCICSFLKDGFCSREAKDRWLLSEYKEPVKLTRLEYEILKHVQKEGFNFITRNDLNDYDGNLYGNLFIYEIKPIKPYSSVGWCTTGKSYVLYAFRDLFQFVKCEDGQPTSIDSILNNCVVNEIKEEK